MQSKCKGVAGRGQWEQSRLIPAVVWGDLTEIYRKQSFFSSAAHRRTCFIKLFVGKLYAKE